MSVAMNHADQPQDSQAFINLSDVCKSYDGRDYVVYDLNLTINKGEFVSLLGPSGSGKTTTLMMLAGFETPSQGEIRMGGKRLDDLPPYNRDIGMVFQNYALFPHMTIAENVGFALSVRKVGREQIKTRVKQALDMVELSHVANRRPSQLSGGQQQRVALARALVFEPSLVLMDEPLGALDKRLREQMQYEIMRLHRELGLTTVYVTHDQSEALTMSDRVAVFFDGRIQQIAPAHELYESPHNAFVANFVGENNGLDGRITEIDHATATLTLSNGTKIRGGVSQNLRQDTPGMLFLRPEQVRIADGDLNLGNRVQGLVEDIVYCGDHHRVHLRLSESDRLLCKLPNSREHCLPIAGSTVNVTWRIDDCKVLSPLLASHQSTSSPC
ncbi:MULTISPECIES: ABC transporter ATP-binding protein [unclassified Oceanobacter]|uniref:ABC transporter ATP-binding protein n=1 Tax=unclassified Oceanobacter TaxID=2620260 RepID=UPI0027356935|nr:MULTISPECIES: ABC transporter ATP-binding protein [unclassified Oceanobacter]MDP2506019.1 ABC transporter ATP-binding protein [Oceanobacter sp. 3_MG-2023]MDP2547598.1 ABC transporter ATP-binding protein [Oceanobacter sp. 4_MG-2023]MDP2608972.1 ABC transporter ATP-binding protein [Oceanobacter sp. 1_MG-2023]MDP2612043.1 ABC transporter ATP-binding protein [Oceanobacter sp. 2_MG-2023]